VRNLKEIIYGESDIRSRMLLGRGSGIPEHSRRGRTRVGYIGGKTANPTYKEVFTDTTATLKRSRWTTIRAKLLIAAC